MNNLSSKVKPTLTPQQEYENQWFEKFSELSYNVMYRNEEGRQLLAHLENKYFRRPVSIPGKEASWAFFNDGFNECIRSFTHGIQAHAGKAQLKAKQEELASKPKTSSKLQG